jgi:hypothetical protein
MPMPLAEAGSSQRKEGMKLSISQEALRHKQAGLSVQMIGEC